MEINARTVKHEAAPPQCSLQPVAQVDVLTHNSSAQTATGPNFPSHRSKGFCLNLQNFLCIAQDESNSLNGNDQSLSEKRN
jgi:hypothetical protein